MPTTRWQKFLTQMSGQGLNMSELSQLYGEIYKYDTNPPTKCAGLPKFVCRDIPECGWVQAKLRQPYCRMFHRSKKNKLEPDLKYNIPPEVQQQHVEDTVPGRKKQKPRLTEYKKSSPQELCLSQPGYVWHPKLNNCIRRHPGKCQIIPGEGALKVANCNNVHKCKWNKDKGKCISTVVPWR